MSETIAKAAAERLSGERPGRWRAIVAAIAAGVAVAVLVYRLLRSKPDGEGETTGDEAGED
jgi:hypothetical protein